MASLIVLPLIKNILDFSNLLINVLKNLKKKNNFSSLVKNFSHYNLALFNNDLVGSDNALAGVSVLMLGASLFLAYKTLKFFLPNLGENINKVSVCKKADSNNLPEQVKLLEEQIGILKENSNVLLNETNNLKCALYQNFDIQRQIIIQTKERFQDASNAVNTLVQGVDRLNIVSVQELEAIKFRLNRVEDSIKITSERLDPRNLQFSEADIQSRLQDTLTGSSKMANIIYKPVNVKLKVSPEIVSKINESVYIDPVLTPITEMLIKPLKQGEQPIVTMLIKTDGYEVFRYKPLEKVINSTGEVVSPLEKIIDSTGEVASLWGSLSVPITTGVVLLTVIGLGIYSVGWLPFKGNR